MRAHTVSFVLASRTPSHILHINIHLHAEELLSSPFEFSGIQKEEEKGKKNVLGSHGVNYYCDVIAIILFFFSAHTTSSLGY